MLIRTRLLTLAAVAALALPATAAAAVTHTVRGGETLTSIAAQDGLSLSALAAANGISSSAQLIAGAELVIPPQGAPVTALAAAPTAAASGPAGGGFRVLRGDTLTGIAARLRTSPAALAAVNGMAVDDLLLAGRTLTIPSAPSAPSAPSDSGSGVPAPSPQFVTPAEVGELAAADGVPAALAEAIADQESGFNDAEVSSTGAVGVMQIEPGTWADLRRLDGLELSPDSALDNVRGGVAVLHSLLAATGGAAAEAIAGYYQGLASVRVRGMFPETRHYVSDVLALEPRFGG